MPPAPKTRAVLALALALALAPCPGHALEDVYEENDSFAAAAFLPYDEHLLTVSTSGPVRDEDWFRVDVQPGTFYVDFAAPAGVRLFLWSAAASNPSGGCLPANGCLWADLADRAFQVATPTTYYLQVVPPSGVTSTWAYELVVSDSTAVAGDDAADAGPGNDSVATATLLAANDAVTGLVAADLDFYAVDVPPGVFTVSVPAANGLVDLELYDEEAGGRVCSWAASVCRHEVAGGMGLRYVTASARRLVVAVVPARHFQPGALAIPYQLVLDHPTKWVATLDYGPARLGSIALADLDGDGREEVLVPTSKGLDDELNEVRPAALLCLDGADGSLRWARTFPAIAGPDPFSGKTYQTTSVSSTPAVADVNGDGQLDVVVGVGGDLGGEAVQCCGASPEEVPGQPGDLGGVYAVDGATRAILWRHVSQDRIGGPTNGGDGRPDGVFSTPLVTELDGTPGVEVVFGSWDMHVYALDGATGAVEWSRLAYDSVSSSPAAADLDGDGRREVLIGGDITANPGAGTETGGIFHAIAADGEEDVPGFDQRVNPNPGNPNADAIRGKYEEQVIWSSPAVADFDGDGEPEVAYGTGMYLSGKGRFVRVWNHDGTPAFLFPTREQTFASVVFADLDGDGAIELIGADRAGWVYAWNGNGALRWETRTTPWCGTPPVGCDPDILGSPLAVDLDGDDALEIVFSQGFQTVVVDGDGTQLSSPAAPFLAMGGFRGSPAVGEIDGEPGLDIVSTGGLYSGGEERATVMAWRWEQASAPLGRYARRQFRAVPEPAGGAGIAAALALAGVVARRGWAHST